MNMVTRRKEGVVRKLFDWSQVDLKPEMAKPDAADLDLIKRILAFGEMQRALREAIFDGNIVNEQGWTILQAVFAHQLRGGSPMRTKVVYELTDLPETTVLRYLQHLEQFGLIKREPDQEDSRVTLVSMSNQGWDWMHEYFGQLIYLERQASERGEGLFSRA